MATNRRRPDLARELEFWMTSLPLRLRSLPVIHLAIPGSHDSMTYGIRNDSGIAPDARQPVQCLKFLGPWIHPTLLRWSQTQCMKVTAQLNSGVRYFDLRIAFKRDEQRFYFVHNLYAGPVEPIFDQMYQFLEDHPSEIVILDCQHFFNMTLDNHRHLFRYLTQRFNSKLLPYQDDMCCVTLDYMDQRRRQVILIYRYYLPDEEAFWPAASYRTPWPDTVHPSRLIEFLNKGLENRDSSLGYVSQCVLTPTVAYVLPRYYASLKECCVMPWQKDKWSWLKEQKPGKGGLNVVISDFVEYEDYRFCKEVINLNLKLVED